MVATLHRLSIGLILTGAFIALWALIGSLFQTPPPPTLKNATLLKTPQPIQAFRLTDTQLQPFNERSFKGHWNLLFFGYPKCPSICPATLRTIKQVFEKFPQDKPKPIRFYFTNLDLKDPEIEPLKTFLAQFHPDFIGLNGNEKNVLSLMRACGIHAFEDGKTETGERKIGHSSHLLMINPQGKLKAIISPPLDPNEIFEDLNKIMNS